MAIILLLVIASVGMFGLYARAAVNGTFERWAVEQKARDAAKAQKSRMNGLDL